MLEAIIFDMDGVIIDSEPYHYEVNKVIFKNLEIDVSDELYNSFYGVSNKYIWQILKDRYKLQKSITELIDIQKSGMMSYLREHEVKPISGLIDLLQVIKNSQMKIGLASSSPVKYIDLVLEKLNIDKYFKVKVSGEEVENSKPAPDIFLKAARLLQIEPRKCLVIEDSCNGVNAAKNAGMLCIGYKNMNSGSQDLSKADVICDDLKIIGSDFINICNSNTKVKSFMKQLSRKSSK